MIERLADGDVSVWLARTLWSNARLRRGYLPQYIEWLGGFERPEGVDR
jgi:hypothetical protein